MAKPRYKAVFLSPHLDDAVFSCGGEIAKQVKQGPVLVLNVFTRYPESMKSHAIVLGAERCEEERAAADFLGYVSLNMDELDAPFRRAEYRSAGNLFSRPVAEDLVYLQTLREKIFGILDGIDYERLYVPLAIGWHVDHLLVYLAFEPWLMRNNVFYYEDAPYCLLPHVVRYRLAELGNVSTNSQDRSLAPCNYLRAWWQVSKAYSRTALMQNLTPAIVRIAAIPVVSLYFLHLLARHKPRSDHPASSRILSPLLESVENPSRKVQAMGMYQSQFREFFHDTEDCKTGFSRYATELGVESSLVERFWSIRQQPSRTD